jgi:hypothetical protein
MNVSVWCTYGENVKSFIENFILPGAGALGKAHVASPQATNILAIMLGCHQKSL